MTNTEKLDLHLELINLLLKDVKTDAEYFDRVKFVLTDVAQIISQFSFEKDVDNS